jgi:alkylhydroperoxidase family enzyme
MPLGDILNQQKGGDQMAWVSPLNEDELKNTSPELYEQLPKPVPGLFRILGQSAGSLQAFLSVTNGAMNQSHLNEELRETIAVTVSHQNECDF